MEEVAKQVQPLHDWQLAFWSNGSGRPPGYFQMRVKQDDERYERLSGAVEKVVDFVETASQRQIEAEDRQKQKEKRIQFWTPIVKWVAGGLLAAMLTAAGWAYREAAPVLKILWDDYLRAHPLAEQRLEKLSTAEPVQVYAGDEPQQAGDPIAEVHQYAK